MAKTIPESHITGDKGVAAFHTYCANHQPFILWRPETVNDFGIDGEVELAAKNSNGKLEATGEILKVQIKSTAKGSYIHNETDDAFEFKPRPEDVEYWDKHRLDVVLVIFDDRTNTLYAKQIAKIDEGYYKKNIPIVIGKAENTLAGGDDNFLERFSSAFKQRINFDIQEKLSTNIFKFTKLPKFVYQFDPVMKTPKEIFDKFDRNERPTFLFHGNKIHTFFNAITFPKFKDEVVEYSTINKVSVRELLKDKDSRKIVIELLNLEFKESCYLEKIGFNRKYDRYYFFPDKTSKDRTVYYDAKKRKNTDRKVVSYKEYKNRSFYKHFAFESKYILNDDGLFIVFNPQYLFTSDGKTPLADKKEITKLTNKVTSREWNQQVLNHVHFIFSFLSKGQQKLTLSVIESSEIEISSYNYFIVPFGIPVDNKSAFKPVSHYNGSNQQSIFE